MDFATTLYRQVRLASAYLDHDRPADAINAVNDGLSLFDSSPADQKGWLEFYADTLNALKAEAEGKVICVA